MSASTRELSPELKALKDRGDKLCLEGDYAEAVEAYSSFISVEPNYTGLFGANIWSRRAAAVRFACALPRLKQ